MANLKALSQRIKSVKSIQKTTRVMQMISASKFRAARVNLACAREYCDKLDSKFNIQRCSPVSGENAAKDLPRELLVIFSSDRGLCGGFNYSIAKAFLGYLGKRNTGVHQEFLFIGTKAYDIVRSKIRDLEGSVGIRVVPQGKLTSFLSFRDFLSGLSVDFTAFSKVSVLYTKFNTMSSQEQVIEDILVSDFEESSSEGSIASTDDMVNEMESSCIYDPGYFEMGEEVLTKGFFGRFYLAACENLACEHCSRMIAMESANSNTSSMLDRLVLSYNRSRQAAITTDLIEVISGCEALG